MRKKIDLTGQKFHKLTVIKEVCKKKNKTTWECHCDCGEIRYLDIGEIKANKSCGCLVHQSNRDDSIIGSKFALLTILSYHHTNSKSRKTYYLCECECGKQKVISKHSIKVGNTKSCGCLHSPLGSKNHNWTGYQEISGILWKSIINGAKSRDIEFLITIEEAWNLFLEQKRLCKLTGRKLILKQRHSHIEANASLDRIDSTKGYILSNVQWIDKDVNMMKRNFNQEYFIKTCKEIVNQHTI